ncbi:LacI family DNA-binding transcriptional regulator [Marinomonas polaris]|uniref:LacI family DNA-binding transcriptional regulator n=1 Tax=Marinomonas polaris TaxID=293552 RepID=UPI003F9A8FE8
MKKVNTMEEFAALAGVSRPTASKYFEKKDAVSPRSRMKIEAMLKEVDYRPNLLASRLMRKDSKIIGVLIPSLGDPFYASIVRSIAMNALVYGYSVMIECSYGDPALESKAIENFLSVKVAGICYAPSGIRQVEKKLHRIQMELPLVFIDAVFEGANYSVRNNNRQTIGLITDYMLGAGRHPAFFPMPNVNSNAKERLDVYLDTMKASDESPIVLPVGQSLRWDFEEWAREEALRMIRSNQLDGDAIICANDRVAFGVISAMFSEGLITFKDQNALSISISGHDNQPLSKFTCPPLTTVEQDVENIGKCAIDMIMSLIGVISDEIENHIKLDGRLIIRESA